MCRPCGERAQGRRQGKGCWTRRHRFLEHAGARTSVYHRLIANGTLPAGHATDDGVGLVHRGTELVGAVTDRPGKAAYRVERGPGGDVVETRLEPRRLV